VCFFTISNHHIANALREAHERGLDVRIVTDDLFAAKAESDVMDLAKEGVSVRTDDSKSALMHNKFCVIDSKYLITGSYNWTAQATYYNQENVVILENPHGVQTFTAHFEELWLKYANFNFDKLKDTAIHHTKLFENQKMEEERTHQKEVREEEKVHKKEVKEEEKKHKDEDKKHKHEEAEEKKKAKEQQGSARPKRKGKSEVVHSEEDEEEDGSDYEHKISKGSKNIKHQEKKPQGDTSPKKRANRAKVAKE